MDIRVGDLPAFEPGIPVRPGPGVGQQAVDSGAFQKQLAYQSNLGGEGASLEKMIGDVDQQAKKLLMNPKMGELAAYREMIRKFLKEVSVKLGKIETRTDRRNRTLVIIRNLDEKLEALTKQVLEDNERGIDLMAALDEIRGMLMDLLV